MKITLTFNPSELKSRRGVLFATANLPKARQYAPTGLKVVVIDVLRACSTITHALSQGCRAIYPFASVRECQEKARAMGRDKVLLGGERGGLRIKGFQLGNSPLEYPREVVEGKDILFTTTNCTKNLRAITHLIPPLEKGGSGVLGKGGSGELGKDSRDRALALSDPKKEGRGANPPLEKGGRGDFTAGNIKEVLICSLLNLPAVADYLVGGMESSDCVAGYNDWVHLALSGTNGEVSLEDVVCGGMLIHRLVGAYGHTPLPDSARLAHVTYLHYKDHPRQSLLDSTHGQRLIELGMKKDVDFCGRVGVYSLIPRFLRGAIRLRE